MTSRYSASLNGTSLSSISNKILITDISYAQAKPKFSTYNVANRQGARVFRKYFEKASVTIKFVIREYSISGRMEICNNVQKWAKNGGVLTTGDRSNQQLRCVCSAFPSITSSMKWTEELSISFESYALPFWESTSATSVTLTAGVSGSGSLTPAGVIDGAMVEVEATANAALSSLALTVNGKTLTLSGLTVASGSKVKITYDENMIQSIKVGNTSVLDKRTGVDDLIAKCGEANTVSYTADASCTVKFSAKGLFA